jgi:hypothetical protein
MQNFHAVFERNLTLFLIQIILASSLMGCRQASSFSGGTGRQGASSAPPATGTPAPQPAPQNLPPVPQQAITQGSFTVWANPPNPVEAQPYNIHIRVKLPSNVSQYGRNDLSGTLLGTDGYVQPMNGIFSFIQPFYFVPGTGFAELVMRIPGAKGGVNDTIKVTSKLINESQSISILFRDPALN